MGYNTRRKSLSLPSLGIQLPTGSRAANRSPPATTATSTTTTTTAAASSQESHSTMPPTKKIKRSHTSGSTSPSPTSPPRTNSLKFSEEASTPVARMAVNTPPPSPGAYSKQTIDTQGIDDEIVVAVIEQLERTGNKPHLLKELATVLSTQLAIVQSSANQSAIISSRLTSYLRRPWSALSPCPVGKELIGTHPKRIYFFLTTCDHQDFPDPEEVNAQNAQARAAARIITPSLSSNNGSAAGSANGEEDPNEKDRRSRQQMSPSPELELDLSMHDDDLTGDGTASYDINMDVDPDVSTLTRSFSGRNSLSREHTHPPTDTRRAVSPPLEGDEREFTRTASELQALAQMKRAADEEKERERRASRELSQASVSGSASSAPSSSAAPATPNSASIPDNTNSSGDIDVKMESATPDFDADATTSIVIVAAEHESEETCALRNSECAKELFGGGDGDAMLVINSPPSKSVHFNIISSPMARPALSSLSVGAGSKALGWSELELKSPEHVDLDELDVLFDSY